MFVSEFRNLLADRLLQSQVYEISREVSEWDCMYVCMYKVLGTVHVHVYVCTCMFILITSLKMNNIQYQCFIPTMVFLLDDV